MRYLLIVLVSLSLLAIPVAAQAGDDEHPAKLMRLLGEWMELAGTRLSASGNTVEPAFVDGKGNTVFNIDKIEINLEIGDVVINKGSGEELAHHLLDMLGEKMRGHGGPPHPAITVAPGKIHGEIRGKMHPGPDMPSEIHRGEMGMLGEMHFEQFHGTPERQEIFEMFQMIPPEVDPGFIEFIMHVGRLAWEHPVFRERLEMMVDKAHERLD